MSKRASLSGLALSALLLSACGSGDPSFQLIDAETDCLDEPDAICMLLAARPLTSGNRYEFTVDSSDASEVRYTASWSGSFNGDEGALAVFVPTPGPLGDRELFINGDRITSAP